jgi:hypothetical protein
VNEPKEIKSDAKTLAQRKAELDEQNKLLTAELLNRHVALTKELGQVEADLKTLGYRKPRARHGAGK